MQYRRLAVVIGLGLSALAVGPLVVERWQARRWAHALDLHERAASPGDDRAGRIGRETLPTPDPSLVVRVDEPGGLLASWQTVGGCGAGAGGGSSIGLKWIGRGVRGGLFNVQEQVSYTRIGTAAYPEYNFFSNTLITTDLAEKWTVGINLPFAYKYLVDPMHLGQPGVAPVDYSNSGLGDIGLLCTRRFGRINAFSVTAMLGLPTGVYDARFTPSGTPINQSQQIGFGRPNASLTLDRIFDEVWGLAVIGGTASYRGGTNKVHNYRSPSATAYGYLGYFLGPFVPAIGLSATAFKDHDQDQDTPMRTPLYSFAANLSIEWSTDWIALLAAASIPYGYDGYRVDDSGNPRSPWGRLPWTASVGVAVSPF